MTITNLQHLQIYPEFLAISPPPIAVLGLCNRKAVLPIAWATVESIINDVNNAIVYPINLSGV